VSRLRGDMLALFASLDGTHPTLYSATSNDEGRSWAQASPTALPSNGDPAQAAVLRSGRLVVVFSNGVRLRCARVRPHLYTRCARALHCASASAWTHVVVNNASI
jgi:hypothetical protein